MIQAYCFQRLPHGMSLHARDARVEWSLRLQLSKHLRTKSLQVVVDFSLEAVESAH
jgi:hypothetical protein